MIKLATVDDSREVAASHHSFVQGLPAAKERALKLVRRTRYWVYDSATRTFSPSKFSGYVSMTFHRYEVALHSVESLGTKFDGGVTQHAIAQVLGDYEIDPDLTRELEAWAQATLGPDALSLPDIDRSKWRFVRLPVVGVGGLAALAGGWEGSEELVEALAEARRSPGRSPPELG